MIELIQDQLASYHAVNQLEEEYAVKEILQEIALYGLWRAGFFDLAAFQGGTSLRILHGMTRFSENLDFILKNRILFFPGPFTLKGWSLVFKNSASSQKFWTKVEWISG